MKLSAFVDLDETLVSTASLINASKLFEFGLTGSFQERLAEKTIFHKLIQDYQSGQTQALENLASNLGIHFFKVPEESEFGGVAVSKLRPQAKHFLQALDAIFDDVYILTAGMKYFQTKIIEEVGIRPYVDDIFAREDITLSINSGIPLVKNTIPILIDDLPPHSQGFTSKFIALGLLPLTFSYFSWEEQEIRLEKVVTRHYQQVEIYTGGSVDRELVNILPAIKIKAELHLA